MPELTYKLKPSCLPESRDINSFGTFLRVMQWTCHCVSWQIDFVGVLFGLWPRFCCFCFFAVCFAVSAGETQVWLGDLRVVVFGWFLWFLCVVLIDLPAQMDIICPCTNVFPAYAHVRTEPLARHRPHSRKKSLRTWIVSFFVGSAVNQLATRRKSGLYSEFQADPLFLLCCNALQVLC